MRSLLFSFVFFFFFKQKTAYEMRISDWSSDVCSSDLTDSLALPDDTHRTPRNDALVVFTPSGRRGRFPVGTPILKAARSLGVDIDSVCGGRGLCGRYQVEIGIGEFAKHGISSREFHVSAWNQTEARYKAKRGLAESRRMSCPALLQRDVV